MTGDAETLTETERLMLRNRMLAGGASEFVDAALASLLSHHIAPTVAAILAAHDERVRADALAPVRAFHHRRPWMLGDFVHFGQTEFPDLCNACRSTWPCPTVAALAAPTSEPTP